MNLTMRDSFYLEEEKILKQMNCNKVTATRGSN